MVTTIQLPIEVKQELDNLKTDSKMSYAQLIKELVEKEKKRKNDLLLMDYGKKYSTENKKEVNEWKETSNEWAE